MRGGHSLAGIYARPTNEVTQAQAEPQPFFPSKVAQSSDLSLRSAKRWIALREAARGINEGILIESLNAKYVVGLDLKAELQQGKRNERVERDARKEALMRKEDAETRLANMIK
jgi:hypothetical protein